MNLDLGFVSGSAGGSEVSGSGYKGIEAGAGFVPPPILNLDLVVGFSASEEVSGSGYRGIGALSGGRVFVPEPMPELKNLFI